jgi:HlyD family secretion protein
MRSVPSQIRLFARAALWLGSLAAVCALAGCRGAEDGADLRTATASRGDLAVRISVRGELKAAKSRKVVVPRLPTWDSTMIAKLVPEGTKVKKGDFLAQLDVANMVKVQREKQANLKRAEAQLAKIEKVMASELSRLEGDLIRRGADVELAEIELTELLALPEATDVAEAKASLDKAKRVEAYLKTEYEAVRRLAEQDYESPAALADAKLEYEIARVERRMAEVSAEQVASGAPVEEVARARLSLKAARIELVKAETE